MSCFLKKCQNFFCEKRQTLYFLFVHLPLTDGYIPVFNRKSKVLDALPFWVQSTQHFAGSLFCFPDFFAHLFRALL